MSLLCCSTALQWLLQLVLPRTIPKQGEHCSYWGCLKKICGWHNTEWGLAPLSFSPPLARQLFPLMQFHTSTIWALQDTLHRKTPKTHLRSYHTILTLLQPLLTEKHMWNWHYASELKLDARLRGHPQSRATVCPRWNQLQATGSGTSGTIHLEKRDLSFSYTGA